MSLGNGDLHCCHPLLAGFVSDYPEQLLGACCKNGTCPKCTVPPDHLGDGETYPLHDLQAALKALQTLDQGPAAYEKNCKAAGIKPVLHPFWEKLKGANIFESITSDVLHQLYQGVIKHLINWIIAKQVPFYVIKNDEFRALLVTISPSLRRYLSTSTNTISN